MSALSRLSAFNGELPLTHAHTIPADWYTDPTILELEKRSVFSNSWQMVGRRDQAARSGNYLTLDLAGEPILVLRGADGKLRGFFNVCRHRAAPLLSEACGSTTKLRCRYHGWTYDLSGALIGTPEFSGVCDFDREENGLKEVAVAEWGPFVWVHIDPPRETIASFLDPLPAWAESVELGSLQFAGRKEYILECNWKVFVDNYLDGGYHVNTVHPSLAGVLDYRQYKTTLHRWCNVQTAPLRSDDAPDDGGAATRTRQGTEAAYWWIFPNLMLNHYQGVMDTNQVFPLGTDRCRVIFDFYFTDADNPDRAAFIAESMAVADRIQAEDIGICAEVQRGLRSRSFTTGRFSVQREAGGYHFHQLLAEHLRAGAAS